jgi:hypothetical protein
VSVQHHVVLAGIVLALWGPSKFAHSAEVSASGGRTDTPEAVIPIEVLPVDPSLAAGELVAAGLSWSPPVIALQPARAARGIVTDESGGKHRVLVLAILGEPERDPQARMLLDVAPYRQAWCDLPGFGIPVSRCFQDTDGDGKLDVARIGTLDAPNPLTLSRVGAAESIEVISYHQAREDELPRYHIGYVSCVGLQLKDSARTEYRFSTTIRAVSGVHWPPPTVCNDVAKPLEQRDGDDPVFQFGRFKVAVRNENGSLKPRLIEGMPTGTLLGHLAIGQPLMDAADAAKLLAENLGDKPFMYFSAAPDITTPVSKNQPLLRGQVVYGLTGRLSSPLQRAGWTGTRTWPAGTPAFGVVMTASGRPRTFAPDVVWCLPGKDDKGRWETFCVAPRERGAVLISTIEPFAVTSFEVRQSDPYVLSPVVERTPVDFGGPLLLTVRYTGAGRRDIDLQWGIGMADEARTRGLRLKRANDGSGYMLIGGAVIKVQPSADGATASVTRVSGEFQMEREALPVELPSNR